MALPMRLVAYAAGFGGGREKGIALVQEAADYDGENRTDARVALVLLFNRERRYDEALKQLDRLRAEYPRNRLFWLETGGTFLRAGRHADANRVLTEGIDRFADDTRPRMFGEGALWYQKRGAARAALGLAAEARDDLQKSIAAEGRRVGTRPGAARARTPGPQGKRPCGRAGGAEDRDLAVRIGQRSTVRERSAPAASMTAAAHVRFTLMSL